MASEVNTDFLQDKKLDSIAADILRPVGITQGFVVWMGFLGISLMGCIYAYYIQWDKGLIVTGLRDYVSWGMYIANFVFFVATSLVGMLISSVLGLIGFKWVKPIARIAEIIAVAFAAVAGLVIVSDMGRPERLANVILHGRIQSPIIWDVTVVTTYLTISILLYFLPLIPDLAISKGRMNHTPKWLQNIYEVLSVKWNHTPEQYRLLLKAIRILLILIIPTAFAIHTVTSWLFAVTLRPGWDSTIFGPYFLTGAFVAGSAAVVIVMYFIRSNYKLEKYLTNHHFDMMGKLLVLVSIVYLYFNINEYLVPSFKMKTAEAIHLHDLFVGEYAVMFWSVQLLGLVIPIILLLFSFFRKPFSMLIISIVVLVAAWFKRFLIVVPTQDHPFLPKQYVPQAWMVYQPTVVETAITVGTLLLVIIIITILVKFFPVIPIWEMAEEQHELDHKSQK
ncbi:MAG: polysulfide reductase NrfD [Bacteroidia bacterium]|nr:polysulfide reductase NrfD [Bacteroidia bacterium]